MNTFTAQVATEDGYQLAEGPVWDPLRERLLWVDIQSGRVHFGRLVASPAGDRIEPAGDLSFPETIGAVVCAEDGRLLVAGRNRVFSVSGAAEDRIVGIPILPETVDSRLNDGGCDPSGRFLIGSMALDGRRGSEMLCRIVEDGSVETIDADLNLSNGLAWSPDGRTMYSIDTVPGVVWARSYDPEFGVLGARQELFRPVDGSPDGMCVDVEGNLWIAIWGAGQVRCYSPAGELLARVQVNAPHTSSVAFAGPYLDLLIITTARDGLSAEDLANFPDSGRLFTARVATSGAPVPYWSGSPA